MREAAPDKTFLAAPTGGVGATCRSCAHCPWMAMNDLQQLARVLEHGGNEIQIEESIRQRAVLPLQRMLDFAASRNTEVLGVSNAWRAGRGSARLQRVSPSRHWNIANCHTRMRLSTAPK